MGGGHTCARRSSGEVLCWGRNLFGPLGDGTTVERSTPTSVVGLTDAVELTGGVNFSCARRGSGVVGSPRPRCPA